MDGSGSPGGPTGTSILSLGAIPSSPLLLRYYYIYTILSDTVLVIDVPAETLLPVHSYL